jgi:hypothetical protein
MKNLLLVLTILISTTCFAQKTVGGVKMPKQVKIGETSLTLNGAGVREKLWIDLYVCGLYVKTKSSKASTIIDSDEYCSIKIQIVSGLISSKKMSDAVEEGFEKSTNGNTKELRPKIDEFKAIFKSSEIEEDDVYDIVYMPKKGVMVFKNGKRFPTIPGLAFKKALFGIWLGEEPADDDLKDDLLGK